LIFFFFFFFPPLPPPPPSGRAGSRGEFWTMTGRQKKVVPDILELVSKTVTQIMSSSLFWTITQRRLVSYRRCGRTYQLQW
jgi:hypothetical protein